MHNIATKFREFFFSTPQRTLGFLAVLILAIAVPITLVLVNNQTNLLQKAATPNVKQPDITQDRAITRFEKICRDGTPQRPKNLLGATWDAGIGDSTDCNVEIIEGNDVYPLSNKCKDTWGPTDRTPKPADVVDTGVYSIRISRNGQVIGGPVQVGVRDDGSVYNCADNVSGGGGGGGGTGGVCSIPLIIPPPGTKPSFTDLPAKTDLCDKIKELDNCDLETNTVHYYNLWWCHPKSRDARGLVNTSVTAACRGWKTAQDSNYLVNFRARVRYLGQSNTGGNPNDPIATGLLLKFITQYGDTDGRRITWNYLMSNVKSLNTTFGWVDYNGDLDYAAQSIFKKSWSQVLAQEKQNNCGNAWPAACRLVSGPHPTTCSSGTCSVNGDPVPAGSKPSYICKNGDNVVPPLIQLPDGVSPPSGTGITGNFDHDTCDTLKGWACNRESSDPVTVDIYRDVPKESGGTFVGSTIANLDRRIDPDYIGTNGQSSATIENDIINNPANCNGKRDRVGWTFNVPSALKTGSAVTLFAYVGNTRLTYFWPQGTPGIDPNTPYYANTKPYQLTCQAASANGSLDVEPKTCDVAAGQSTCSTTITASFSNAPSAEVCVSTDGGSETSFWGVPGGSGGSQVAPWIQPNHSYTFRLHTPAGKCTGAVLDTFSGVTANAPPAQPTNTPTPTPTPPPPGQPTNTPVPTATIPPGASSLVVTVELPGVSGNAQPQHPQREVTATLIKSDASDQIKEFKGTVIYTPSQSAFVGTINLGTDFVPSNYLIKLRMESTLRKQVRNPDTFTIASGSQVTLPKVALVQGDMTLDNRLDGQDYNLFLGCFQDKPTCTSGDRVHADLTDDGKLSPVDIGILIRSFQTREGD